MNNYYNIIEKWNQIKQAGKDVRNDIIINDLASITGKYKWNELEEELLKSILENHFFSYSNELLNRQESFKFHLNNNEIFAVENNILGVKNAGKEHFFIQLFRIPHLNPNNLPFIKLMQIAFNIGQFMACFKDYPEIIQNYFVINHLDNISSYIDLEY